MINFVKEFGFWIVGRRSSCQEYLSYVMSFSVWSPVKPTILLYFVSLTPELVPSSAECKSDGFGDNSTLVDQEFICSIYSHAGKSFARGREGSASDRAGMQFCNFPYLSSWYRWQLKLMLLSGATFQRVGPCDFFCVHSWLWRNQAWLQHINWRLKRELGDCKVKFKQLSSLNNLFLLHHIDKFSNTQNSDSVNDTHIHCKQEESPVWSPKDSNCCMVPSSQVPN
jgi:hypothetical protein